MSTNYGVTPFGTALNGSGPILNQECNVTPVFQNGCRLASMSTKKGYGLQVIDGQFPIASVTDLNGLIVATIAVANPNNPAIIANAVAMAMFSTMDVLSGETIISRLGEAFVETLMTTDPEIEFAVDSVLQPNGSVVGTLYCSVPAKYSVPLPRGNVASTSFGHTVLNAHFVPAEVDYLTVSEAGVSVPARKSPRKA